MTEWKINKYNGDYTRYSEEVDKWIEGTPLPGDVIHVTNKVTYEYPSVKGSNKEILIGDGSNITTSCSSGTIHIHRGNTVTDADYDYELVDAEPLVLGEGLLSQIESSGNTITYTPGNFSLEQMEEWYQATLPEESRNTYTVEPVSLNLGSSMTMNSELMQHWRDALIDASRIPAQFIRNPEENER